MRGGRKTELPARVFTREACEVLARRIFSMAPDCQAEVEIESHVTASTSFARGEAHIATEAETVDLGLTLVTPAGYTSTVSTNRIDDVGLAALVAEAQSAAKEHRSPHADRFDGPTVFAPFPPLYFDATQAAAEAENQAVVLRTALDAADAEGLVAAGDLNVDLAARAKLNTRGFAAYVRESFGEFSVTARTKDGSGSGWGWGGYEDWSRVKANDVIAHAVDLGKRSAQPVAVEPGRYTVILEPSAVASLLTPLHWNWSARGADQGYSIYGKEPTGSNKIGLQMIDRQLRIVSDPWDSERPASTIRRLDWEAIPGAVTWFEDGTLKHLEYDPEYAREKGTSPIVDPRGFRLETTGPTTTLEEMIASTARGIWINRLSHVATMKRKTMLITGTTRDGAFLIEKGKVTKPIKNLRFTESPYFVLNKLDAAGPAIRASRNVVAPRIKVRDFDFTSLTDAV